MPVPRRRHGPSRQGKDRAHKHLTAVQTIVCEVCSKPRLPHRVCPHCGTYKKQQVVEVPKD